MKEYKTDTMRLLCKDGNPDALRAATGLITEQDAALARRFHRSIPGYEETRLVRLREAAAHYGIRDIFVKDESTRFGLKAFKGLGGSYSMFRILCEQLGLDPETADYQTFRDPEVREKCGEVTFVTATDGNHGKGVAWAAALFGCQAHVYMPKGSAKARRQAIEEAGRFAIGNAGCQTNEEAGCRANEEAGTVTAEITDLNYDQTVEYASRLASENGWILIQDTAWDGYEKIPHWIIEGYLTLGAEATEQLAAADLAGAAGQPASSTADRAEVQPATGGSSSCSTAPAAPTHVFLQAGVGAMAGGITAYLLQHYHEAPPKVFIVEPETVACIYLSAKAGDGRPHSVEGDPETIMAGLNCGTPCSITWPVLRNGASGYIACADTIAEFGMRAYHDPLDADEQVISGESGAATYGAVLTILESEELRTLCGIEEDSVILLVNTEGDTDPENYERVIGDCNQAI